MTNARPAVARQAAGPLDQDLIGRPTVGGRRALSGLAYLTDQQLDSVPPASDMKFCDGKRSLEQIVTNLLNHQSHNADVLKAAILSGTENAR